MADARSAIILRLAHALAWDFSTQHLAKRPLSPRAVYQMQTEGCKERFRESAADLLDAIERAGLVLRVKGGGR